MSDADITFSESAGKGRYVLSIDGHEAVMTYVKSRDGVIIADHTGVPDALRGKGAGQILLVRMVEDARARGVRIIPQCPFVEAMRLRHPEWADVFTT